jgi:hypothetical protein
MRVRRPLVSWLLGAILAVPVGEMSAQGDPAAAVTRKWRVQHEREILEEFTRFLSLPNVTTDRDGIARNASALGAMLRARGITEGAPATLSERLMFPH